LPGRNSNEHRRAGAATQMVQPRPQRVMNVPNQDDV
jgi:hypothetical protein